jgi:hypothetical protein
MISEVDPDPVNVIASNNISDVLCVHDTNKELRATHRSFVFY